MRSHHSPVSNSWGVKLNFAKWGPSILREWPFVFILGEGSGSSKFVSRICPTLLDRLLFKVSFPPPLVISWSIRQKGKYLIEVILGPVLPVLEIWFHKFFVIKRNITSKLCLQSIDSISFLSTFSRNCSIGGNIWSGNLVYWIYLFKACFLPISVSKGLLFEPLSDEGGEGGGDGGASKGLA